MLQQVVGTCLMTRDLDSLWMLGDPAEVVPQLPPAAVYHLSRVAEYEDRQLLVLHAAVEQIQCCWDMDTWNRDRFDPAGADGWLARIVELPDEAWLEKIHGLLQDGFGLHLLSRVVIFNLKMEAEHPEDTAYYTTPDEYFELQPLDGTPEDAWNTIIRFIDRWYETDATGIQQLLLATIMEFPTALEEESYRLRNGRIRDEGFWDSHSAQAVYTPVDPARISIDRLSAPLEPPVVRSFLPATPGPAPRDVFAASLEGLTEGEQDAVRSNFALLCNRMTAADGVDIADETSMSDVLDRARAGVNLGLSYFVRHRKVPGVDILRSLHVSHLFQCGYFLQKQTSILAATLMRTGVVSLSPGTSTLLEGPWSAFFAAQLERHPKLDPGLGSGGRAVAASELEQIALITELLEELSVFKGLCFEVLGLPASLLTEEGAARTTRRTPGAITFGDLFRSAAVALVVRGKTSAVPLTRPAVRQFYADPANLKRATHELTQKLAVSVALTPRRLARIVATHLAPLASEKDPEAVLLLRRIPPPATR
ncbi:hypothetical protein KKD52_07260 [Myxococcota bacterium]|nr:hypothetical protein [Myxococcota bacterium]MBU1411519.1 hypothetical protein [Myxococcota bacterium]MBU1510144.1 hypothetical protein [Myxococcota bacterium]